MVTDSGFLTVAGWRLNVCRRQSVDSDTMDKRRDLVETGLFFYFFLFLAVKYIRETFWVSLEYETKYS